MTAIEYYKKFGYVESKLLADNNSHSIVDAGDGETFHINDLKEVIRLVDFNNINVVKGLVGFESKRNN